MIIIDSDHYEDYKIETMFFPGGEPHVKIPLLLPQDDIIFLFLKLRTWNDAGIAACILDALQRTSRFVIPFVPYFPGARQDRVLTADLGKYPLTVEIVSALLAPRVAVFDHHSYRLADHIDYCSFNFCDLKIPIKDDVVGIISPDEGATDRANRFRKQHYPNADLIQFYKKRDAHTGYLEIDKNLLPVLEKSGRYIIVDDICDGGGTFNLLAEAFYGACGGEEKYHKLELFVSHGIFSKGLSAIDPRIEHITTTDSWCRQDLVDPGRLSNRLTVLPLNQLFNTIKEIFEHA